MKYNFYTINILLFVMIASFGCKQSSDNEHVNENTQELIKGWNILSKDESMAMKALDAVPEYSIDHLQISHHIVMDLKDLRDANSRDLTNRITKKAHEKGVEEVTVWDHALYHLDYYPDEFKTGPDSTINLDNPEFWKWLKDDYREMLDLVPDIDGIILTFIETGAHVEDQYSEKLDTEAEKLAALVDTLAGVIIDERQLSLYTRSFIYTRQEMGSILGMFDEIKRDDITVMMKATPHDFFLTHPVNYYVKQIDRPVLVEFDATGEYNGQSVVANTFVEEFKDRWTYFLKQANVVGYVARTDRYGDTQIIGKSAEINLFTLNEVMKDTSLTADEIYDAFIVKQYGEKALPHLKPAFKKAEEIIRCSFYTLGLNSVSHSWLNFDYPSIYSRHVSGKWMDSPVVKVGHGVDKSFHYWKDIVEHLSPARYKKDGEAVEREAPWVLDSSWVTPEERMNMEYLNFVIAEKNHGVELAREALEAVKAAKPFINDSSDYKELYHTFDRTLITSQLRRGGAKAYYGNRIYQRGEAFRTEGLKRIIREGLHELKKMAEITNDYPVKAPVGQWDWHKEADAALKMHREISEQQ